MPPKRGLCCCPTRKSPVNWPCRQTVQVVCGVIAEGPVRGMPPSEMWKLQPLPLGSVPSECKSKGALPPGGQPAFGRLLQRP